MQLFNLVFLEFETFYTGCIDAFLAGGGRPEFAVMEFNAIRKRYVDELTARVHAGQFDEAFASQARGPAASPLAGAGRRGAGDDAMLSL